MVTVKVSLKDYPEYSITKVISLDLNPIFCNVEKNREFIKKFYFYDVYRNFFDGNDCETISNHRDEIISFSNSSEKSETLEDISPIKFFRKAESISISKSSLSNLEPLKNMLNIKKLILFNNNITNIEPLKYLLNLESIDLGNHLSEYNDNKIESVWPLVELPKLKHLDLSRNEYERHHHITSLKQLESLYYEANNLTEANVFKDMSELKEIRLYGNPICEDEENLKNPEIFPQTARFSDHKRVCDATIIF